LWPRVRTKLDLLNASTTLEDLRLHPSNRLEKLRGEWAGFYSVRVNDQYRVVFPLHQRQAIDVRCTITTKGDNNAAKTSYRHSSRTNPVPRISRTAGPEPKPNWQEHWGIPLNRVNELVRGKRGVTPKTALLLAEYFKNSR